MIYLFQIRAEPFARHLVANPLVYDIEARQMLQGEPSGAAFFMSPLYPGFVALAYRLVRPDHLIIPLVQGLLMALNVFLLGLVSRRLIGDIAALAAALIMSLYWSFYYFAGEMVPVTLLLTFMLLAALLYLERDGRRQTVCMLAGLVFAGALYFMRGLPGLLRPAGGDAYSACLLFFLIFAGGAALLMAALIAAGRLRSLANLAAGGLLLGTACLVWGAAIVLALPLTLMLLKDGPRRLAKAGIFVLALSIPLAGSLTHNRVASGERALVTTSFGINIFLGNNPDSDGMDPFRFGRDDSLKREADGLRLTGSRRSEFFAGHAYTYMKEDTSGWLRLLGRKALLSVSRYEIDNNADISERRDAWRRLRLPRLHFGLVFPFALAGIVVALRRRGISPLPVWGFVAFTAVCIVFFVCERFRLPGIVFLIPLSVVGASLLIRGIAGRSRRTALAILLVLAGAAVSNADFLAIADYEFPSVTVNKAYVERLDGNNERARQYARLAISREPGNAGAHFQLGAIDEAEGDRAGAIGYYLGALERNPFHMASYNGARRVLEGAGINTAYLDRYVEALLRGGEAEDLKQQIRGFVD